MFLPQKISYFPPGFFSLPLSSHLPLHFRSRIKKKATPPCEPYLALKDGGERLELGDRPHDETRHHVAIIKEAAKVGARARDRGGDHGAQLGHVDAAARVGWGFRENVQRRVSQEGVREFTCFSDDGKTNDEDMTQIRFR